ncbi:hypothetical protein OHA77_22190 [Streptosporangium sp. NBC_01639]|uniref:hypothetical protein n=1 Tax=unclassified Streptosporangium TaxID=2632669 RepID=UPI002DDC6982|nr:hypothetical protein [Streptosporangium sp. NBC_01756]WSC89973.1 hypothetical protein OIE48_17855 [Streptosporangium sp. NBC_01756]WTD51397.1 hypothetical protein OHA77_22190 [Streptosporangium sp. NBC_01639]
MTAVRQWDCFDTMESDVRTMVADHRWSALALPARAQAIALRTLTTPDGGRWLFGAHARWYRQDPADGHWHLSAPPADPGFRAAARVVHATSTISLNLVPAGPDFTVDRGSVQGFVGPDVPPEITERVRELVIAQRGRRREDFPLTGPFTELFAGEVASPVAAVWGTLMWCAYAPAFDGNEVLLSMFGEFLARPLPGDEWVRWLPPASLDDLVALYGERVRAGHPEAGLRLVALMADTAEAIRDDRRFRPRADALLTMVEPVLRRTGPDSSVAHQGDDAVRRAWLSRCPPHVTLPDSAPAEHFQHAVYDLVQALGFIVPKGADPRAVAASLLAADLAASAPRAADALYPWLDPELRHILHVVLNDPSHPLRGCWPRSGELPAALHPPDRTSAAALLGAAYATGLAWCRLSGTTVPDRGFTTASALVHRLAHERDDPAPGISGTFPGHF